MRAGSAACVAADADRVDDGRGVAMGRGVVSRGGLRGLCGREERGFAENFVVVMVYRSDAWWGARWSLFRGMPSLARATCFDR